MKRIIDFFKQWDKLAHTCAGFLIMLWVTTFGLFFFNYWTAIPFGIVVTLVISAGKEIYDKLFGGVAEWDDFFACVVGMLLATIPIIVIGLKLIA